MADGGEMTEEAAKYWIEDAKERMADNDRLIDEQAKMIDDMHKVISQCADALHQAQRTLAEYIDIKDDYHHTVKKRKPRSEK